MLVMEYASYGNLRNFILDYHSKLRWETKLRILLMISMALQDIHQSGHVHCNFHSGNVLITDNTIKIADFGLCGPADKPQTKVYGNMPYMAPKIIRGGVYTLAANIYSIGMLMYEVVIEHLPFLGLDSDIHLAFEICRGI